MRQTWTAPDSDVAQGRAAHRLQQLGLGRGDRVLVMAHSTPATYHVITAALRIGVVPVCLNPVLTPEEQADLREDADPHRVLTPAEVETMTAAGPTAELSRWPLSRPLLYTSGTTGRPKGVYSGVWDESTAEQVWRDEAEAWGVDRSDRYVQIAPLHHSAPYRFALITQLMGGSVTFLGRFDAAHAVAAVDEVRPTFTFCAPIHLRRMLDHNSAATTWSSFRRLAHAGAPCPESVSAAATAALPDNTVWEFYGSTEGQFTVASPADHRDAPESVGRARAGRRLFTRDGVLWCETPPFTRFTYWRDPERTAQVWDGSAFTVGDLGRVDGNGFVYLDGRRNDLIITGGVNVCPLEVETALRRAPGVVDVAVFGALDEEWGQRVCAAAVIDGTDASTLERFARDHLAPHKRPKQWVKLDEIPTTSTGKIQRSRLAATLGMEAATATE